MKLMILTVMMFLGKSTFGAAAGGGAAATLVTTFAGTPRTEGHLDGQRDQAQFCRPGGLLELRDGRILVAGNHCIRCIDGDQVTTFAGRAGERGYQDGPGNQAQFFCPNALLEINDGSGRILILVADAGNHCIRCIDLVSNNVTTFAGTRAAGHLDGQKDLAQFCFLGALLQLNDGSGRILVADLSNDCIRCIDGDQVTTFAGRARAPGHLDGQKDQAQFCRPGALLQLNDGRILVAGNHCIRCIGTDDQVTTFAGIPGTEGHQDGQKAQAQFSSPTALLELNDGSILVADYGNHCIRCIGTDDQVTTFAGTAGAEGHQDGPKDQAQFSYPTALLQLNDGRILVADSDNHCIRCIETEGDMAVPCAEAPFEQEEELFDGGGADAATCAALAPVAPENSAQEGSSSFSSSSSSDDDEEDEETNFSGGEEETKE